jgi:hypothetical protein
LPKCVSLLLTTHFGKCGYAVPSSPSDLVYLAAAHSTAASLEPWSWPVVVRGRDANTTHPIGHRLVLNKNIQSDSSN